MKIIDKDGNVLFEGEQKRPSHIYMGTARRIGNSRRMRPTVIRKEELDGSVFKDLR